MQTFTIADLSAMTISEIAEIVCEAKLEQLKNTKRIESLNLTPRVLKALKEANVITIGDLLKLSSREVYKIPEIGKKGVTEIKDKLAEKGYFLS